MQQNQWRKEWANILNEYAKENNVALTYSEKSFTGQDIEKIPLIRMNRETYYIEKMAKAQANENGYSYVPVTEIGKQNAAIEEINQAVAGTKKQLVSIEDRLKDLKYTNQKQMLLLYGIDEFNKINPLTEKQRDSYKAIKRRTKETVDFGVAKQLQKELIHGSWKKYHFQKDRLTLICGFGLSEEIEAQVEAAAKELGFNQLEWIPTGGVVSVHGGPSAFGMVGIST